MPDDDFNKIRECKMPRREPPEVRLGATVWASVERNELAAMRKELTDLRALVARARAMAKRIGEADGRAKLAREDMAICKEVDDDELFYFVRAVEAETEAINARRELLAMFGEGK